MSDDDKPTPPPMREHWCPGQPITGDEAIAWAAVIVVGAAGLFAIMAYVAGA